MIPNRQLQLLIGIVLAALAVVLLMQGKGVPLKDFYNAFSYVVSAIAFILLLWERYLALVAFLPIPAQKARSARHMEGTTRQQLRRSRYTSEEAANRGLYSGATDVLDY